LAVRRELQKYRVLKRSALRLGLSAALLCATSLGAQAGFEWSPSSAQEKDVPVVSPSEQNTEPKKPQYKAPATMRDIVVPTRQESRQPQPTEEAAQGMPAALPGLQQSSAQAQQRQRPQEPERSYQRSLRMIEKSKESTPSGGSSARGKPVFTPMPDDPEVYEQAQERTTQAPVPLVFDNMEDMVGMAQRERSAPVSSSPQPAASQPSSSERSYPRRARPSVSAPQASGYSKPADMQRSAPSKKRRVQINPYPNKGGEVKQAKAAQASVQTQQRVQAAPTPSPRNYESVPGFGNDIPMIMAIQQVIPDGFTYSFAPSIDLSAKVSWQGDRPWNEVLRDMLEPLGYQAHIAEQRVVIR